MKTGFLVLTAVTFASIGCGKGFESNSRSERRQGVQDDPTARIKSVEDMKYSTVVVFEGGIDLPDGKRALWQAQICAEQNKNDFDGQGVERVLELDFAQMGVPGYRTKTNFGDVEWELTYLKLRYSVASYVNSYPFTENNNTLSRVRVVPESPKWREVKEVGKNWFKAGKTKLMPDVFRLNIDETIGPVEAAKKSKRQTFVVDGVTHYIESRVDSFSSHSSGKVHLLLDCEREQKPTFLKVL